MRSKAVVLALAAFPCFNALADDVRLPEVVVREKADSDRVPLHPAGDTAALLGGVPGFSVQSAGGVSSLPVLRGLADDRIKVRIDGAEITSACGNHMNPPLSYIDPTQVTATQVVAGIAPVSLGGDSIAGSIDVRSWQPVFATAGEKTRVFGEIAAVGRSVDHGLAAILGASAASERMSIGYSAATTEGDSYQDGRGRKVPDTLYKSTNQSVGLAAQGNGNRWVLRIGEQRVPYQGFPNQPMDMVRNHGVFANLGYTGDFAWGRLDALLYWQDTRHKMGFFTQEKTGTMPMDTHGRDIGYTLKAELPVGHGGILRLGNEYHRAELDDWWPPVAMSMMMSPNTFVNINDGKRERLAFFAEWDAKLDSRWTSLLGIRSESVRSDAGRVQDYGCGMMCMSDTLAAAAFNARNRSKRDNALDLTALLAYAPSPVARYEFGYARKTRAPNLYERYTWGRGNMAMAMIGWFGDGNGYVGDIDLKPEVAHTLSATADWHDAGSRLWNVRLTPFYTRVEDFIDVDDLGPGGMMGPTRKLRFANHDAHLYGINLSWHAPAWESSTYGSAEFKGKFDWTRGRRNDGGDLYHIMPANLALGVEQRLHAWTHVAELKLVGAKSRVDDRRVEGETAGYALVDLASRYRFGNGLSVQVGVRNLFDRFYALPLGGVNLAASPRVPLYGQGRSVDLGLALTF